MQIFRGTPILFRLVHINGFCYFKLDSFFDRNKGGKSLPKVGKDSISPFPQEFSIPKLPIPQLKICSRNTAPSTKLVYNKQFISFSKKDSFSKMAQSGNPNRYCSAAPMLLNQEKTICREDYCTSSLSARI